MVEEEWRWSTCMLVSRHVFTAVGEDKVRNRQQGRTPRRASLTRDL